MEVPKDYLAVLTTDGKLAVRATEDAVNRGINGSHISGVQAGDTVITDPTTYDDAHEYIQYTAPDEVEKITELAAPLQHVLDNADGYKVGHMPVQEVSGEEHITMMDSGSAAHSTAYDEPVAEEPSSTQQEYDKIMQFVVALEGLLKLERILAARLAEQLTYEVVIHSLLKLELQREAMKRDILTLMEQS